MGSVPPLLTFLLMVVSGWVQRRQLIVIEFLQAENRLLKERLRGKRIRFSDAERALLARKAKATHLSDPVCLAWLKIRKAAGICARPVPCGI